MPAIYRKKDHCVFLCDYHIVIPTKYRRKIIDESMKAGFPFIKQVYWGTDSIWSEGYFVSTVGIDRNTIEAYIANQGKADSGQNNLKLF